MSDYSYLLWTTLAEFPGIMLSLLLIEKIGRKYTMAVEFLGKLAWYEEEHVKWSSTWIKEICQKIRFIENILWQDPPCILFHCYFTEFADRTDLNDIVRSFAQCRVVSAECWPTTLASLSVTLIYLAAYRFHCRAVSAVDLSSWPDCGHYNTLFRQSIRLELVFNKWFQKFLSMKTYRNFRNIWITSSDCSPSTKRRF